MRDIAELAGVSKMTVSRALRGNDSVSAEARRRIQAAIDKTGYVADELAASFSTGRSGFIAVVIPSIDNSNFSQTIAGISDTLEAAGKQILLADTDYSVEKEEKLVRTLLGRRPEGIIVTGGSHTENTRKLLKQSDIPVVEMWDLPPNPIGHCIGFSHAQASADMVRFLADKGYRNLAFIGGATTRDTRGADRRRGFIKALKELGLPDGRIITFGDPPITVDQGAAAVVQLLELYPETDAAICVSDLSAFGAIMECRRRGIDVPGRLAITGFGDFEIARACFPSITTIGCDWKKLGRNAAMQILTSLQAKEEGEIEPPSMILSEYRILRRESA